MNINEKYNFEEKSFEAGGETVYYQTSTSDPIEQTLINLGNKDREFINYWLGEADGLLQTVYGKEKSIHNYSERDLDELINLWNYKKHNFRYVEEEEFIHAVGSAFGNYLNREFNTKWVIIDDEYGTDYACVSTNEHNFQLFPFSSAGKAVDQKREYSLHIISLIVKKNIEDQSWILK